MDTTTTKNIVKYLVHKQRNNGAPRIIYRIFYRDHAVLSVLYKTLQALVRLACLEYNPMKKKYTVQCVR